MCGGFVTSCCPYQVPPFSEEAENCENTSSEVTLRLASLFFILFTQCTVKN